jgi:hypothetical protein
MLSLLERQQADLLAIELEEARLELKAIEEEEAAIFARGRFVDSGYLRLLQRKKTARENVRVLHAHLAFVDKTSPQRSSVYAASP